MAVMTLCSLVCVQARDVGWMRFFDDGEGRATGSKNLEKYLLAWMRRMLPVSAGVNNSKWGKVRLIKTLKEMLDAEGAVATAGMFGFKDGDPVEAQWMVDKPVEQAAAGRGTKRKKTAVAKCVVDPEAPGWHQARQNPTRAGL